MSMVKMVETYKGSFRNYDKCHRVAEIMDIKDNMRIELFNSWYSNWFIFMPVFLYKMYQYDKKAKKLDAEFNRLCNYLEFN